MLVPYEFIIDRLWSACEGTPAVSLCLFEQNFTAAISFGHILKVNKKHRKINSYTNCLSIISEDCRWLTSSHDNWIQATENGRSEQFNRWKGVQATLNDIRFNWFPFLLYLSIRSSHSTLKSNVNSIKKAF